MDVPFWVWALTIGLIVGMLIFDLVGHVRTPHAPTLRESAIWSGVYVGLEHMFPLGDPPDYEPPLEASAHAVAERAGRGLGERLRECADPEARAAVVRARDDLTPALHLRGTRAAVPRHRDGAAAHGDGGDAPLSAAPARRVIALIEPA